MQAMQRIGEALIDLLKNKVTKNTPIAAVFLSVCLRFFFLKNPVPALSLCGFKNQI
jgi:hypothetical protein